jgi:hypothetical protein
MWRIEKNKQKKRKKHRGAVCLYKFACYVCVCVQVAAHLTLQHVVDNIKCIYIHIKGERLGLCPVFPSLVSRAQRNRYRQEKEEEENVYIFLIYNQSRTTVVHYMPQSCGSLKKKEYLFCCCFKKKTFFLLFFGLRHIKCIRTSLKKQHVLFFSFYSLYGSIFGFFWLQSLETQELPLRALMVLCPISKSN